MVVSIILSLFTLLQWNIPNEQNDQDYFIRNYDLKIPKIDVELKSINLPEYKGNIININTILKNNPLKKELSKGLSDFLIKENIFNEPNKDIKSKFSALARFKYSSEFDSYFLLSEQGEIDPFFTANDLILLNIKSGSLLSVCRIAAYYQDRDGYHLQRQTIYQGNEKFVNLFEELSSDVEYTDEDSNLVDEPPNKTLFMIDKVTGKAKLIEK